MSKLEHVMRFGHEPAKVSPFEFRRRTQAGTFYPICVSHGARTDGKRPLSLIGEGGRSR